MKKILFLTVILLAIFLTRTDAQEFSITIDALKDAFYEGLTGPADGLVYLPARCYLRDIGSAPIDDMDLSATVWMAYDEDYLYFYEEVTDDNVRVSNSSTWNNDCIEIKFDPNPSAGTGAQTSNCRLTALDSAEAELEAGVDNLNKSGHLEDVAGVDYIPTPEDYARRLTDDGYVLEFRVPLSYINEPGDNRFMVTGEGVKFGMAININDNDSGTRDHMLQWSAGHTDAAHSQAIHHGSVTYLPGHKLGLEAVSPRDPQVVNDSADVWYTTAPVGITESYPVETFEMLSNYPNPFNPNTSIKYPIKQAGRVSLEIYSVTGELIRSLIQDQSHVAGSHEITWDGRNDSGQAVNSGIYFCRLITPLQVLSLKMTLIK